MPRLSKRSGRKKRSKDITISCSPEDLELFDRAADRSFEIRATWAYRRLIFAARKELGLDTEPKK